MPKGRRPCGGAQREKEGDLVRPDIFTGIVLCAVIVSYAVGKIPLVVTAMLSMLALYFTGIISFQEAFSGFSNNAVMMLIGMQMLGLALSDNGIVDILSRWITDFFTRKAHLSEKHFILISGVLAAGLSTVLNPTLVVLMFMEIIDGLAAQPGSQFTRKHTYLPLCIASTYGALFTSISATTLVVTSGLIAESSVGRPLNFLEPMPLGIAAMAVFVLVYATFGYRLEQRCFDFQDILSEEQNRKNGVKKAEPSPKKLRLTLYILAAAIGLFVFSDFSLGAVSLAAGAALILTGCISAQRAFEGVKWQTTVLVACCLGFAKGVDISGAGVLIARGAVQLFGAVISSNPVILLVLALVISSLLSNVMNNSSAAAVLVPIFITIAEEAAIPVLPAALAVGVGAMLASATPICAPVFTIATSAGYRFKDYLRVGGLVNLLSIIACTAVLNFMYIV